MQGSDVAEPLLLHLNVLNWRIMWWMGLGAMALLAVACLWTARVNFATMKAYVDAQAPDGTVESFDRFLHGRITRNLRWLGALLSMTSLGMALATRRLFATNEVRLGQWSAFRTDLREGWAELVKRTSRSHVRWVLFVILIGTSFRVAQLRLGIIYDEAFTYTYYATQPLHFILSNYSYPNNHILHTLLVKLSTSIFGLHLWSVRLPAFLAGVAVMPLYYVFVRAMFNRYIALMAMALVAASGALIEYSALARGYSLTWLFMVCAMLAGRYFAKSNNIVGALLVAVFNALGMWAVPTMIYASMACYTWLLLYLLTNYDNSLRRRLLRLAISLVAFMVLTAAVYTPVVVVHSLDHLMHHPTMGESTWAHFLDTHQEKAFELWAYFNDTSLTLISLLGFVGLIYAAYVSGKYRIMLIALVFGAVPFTIIQSMVGPPRIWTYVLFNLHMSSAIALFYALKFIEEKVYAGFSKRFRTVLASMLILAGMGWLGLSGTKDRIVREDDARSAADWFQGILRPNDRVLTQFPNEAAFEFHLMANGNDRRSVHLGPGPGGRLYALVGPADGQTLESVLKHNGMERLDTTTFDKVKDWKRLEIFAAR
jgi:hypothetical protein